MGTIQCFEDLMIWKLARKQCQEFFTLAKTTSLSRDLALKNQMDRSSGSVMDCIAEGFERSGNAELRQFLMIAKGSNGEYRSQLIRCCDRNHISADSLKKAVELNQQVSSKIMSFVRYLQQSSFKGQRYHSKDSSP